MQTVLKRKIKILKNIKNTAPNIGTLLIIWIFDENLRKMGTVSVIFEKLQKLKNFEKIQVKKNNRLSVKFQNICNLIVVPNYFMFAIQSRIVLTRSHPSFPPQSSIML